MDWTELPHERRRAMRVRSKGTVRIHHGDRLIRGQILDLCVGGVSIRADLPIGLASHAGEPVRIDVELHACSRQFSLAGHFLRSQAATKMIAIEFDDAASDFKDFVQDELLAAAEHDTLPRMILVDEISERRDVFAKAFRGAGCSVTEVSTPHQAIAWLEQVRFEPGLIAIADSVPQAIAEDLRSYLCEQYPETHMVAIGGSNRRSDKSGSWLCWGDARHDLHIRVGRVITAHGTRHRSIRSLPLARRRASAMRARYDWGQRPLDDPNESTFGRRSSPK
jgi:CheY-like chemotaxis protein